MNFDEIVLLTYIVSLSILMIFASHGFIMVYYQSKYGKNIPKEKAEEVLHKTVTIQLPLYNEMYVSERLIDAVCAIDFPKEQMEIQVLDDSTDQTVEVVAKIVEEKQKLGFNIKHIHRTDRSGYKAGALKEGLKSVTGEYVAIFDADFIPKPDFLKNTLKFFADDNVGMVVQCNIF